MINRIKDNWPLITVLIILLGYLNTYSLYYWFGIPIHNYLDTSEIIFSFSDILPEIASIIIMVAVLFGIEPILYYKVPSTSEIKSGHDPLKKLITVMLLAFGFIVLITLYAAILTIYQLLTNFILISVAVLIILLYSSIALYLSYYRLKKYNKPFSFNKLFNSIIIFTIIVFTMVLAFRNYHRYLLIIDGKPKLELVIDRSFGSNETNFYIGSTKNYIFFFDSIGQKVEIYPQTEVKFMQIRELRKFGL